MEQWKPIKGFEDYEVSDAGRIRSLDHYVKNGVGFRIVRGRILKLIPDKNGYYMIGLKRGGKHFPKKVHRLVAEAFISNPESKPQINHKNFVKTDNRVSNIEWVTQSENMLHSYRNGNMDNALEKKRKPVKCSNGMVFNSSYDAANYLNVNVFKGKKKIRCIAGRIRRCAAKHQDTAYGFTWEYDSKQTSTTIP